AGYHGRLLVGDAELGGIIDRAPDHAGASLTRPRKPSNRVDVRHFPWGSRPFGWRGPWPVFADAHRPRPSGRDRRWHLSAQCGRTGSLPVAALRRLAGPPTH